MVLQKRLDYGFNGYQAPPIPRAARSARKRAMCNKIAEGNKMCAIDLLATVAGHLLLEKVSSSSSSSKAPSEKEKEKEKDDRGDDNNKEFKVEPCNQSTITSKPVSEEFPSSQRDDHSGSSSVMTALNFSERLVVTKNSDDGEIKNEVVSLCSKVEEDEPPMVYSKSGGCKLDGETNNNENGNIVVKDELTNNKSALGARTGTCGVKSPVVSAAPEMKMESLVPLHSRDSNVKIVNRDDDEISSGCTHPSPRSRTRSKCFRQAPRIGDRRIRKILASKHWRPTPRYKDDSDRVFKPNFRNRKECFKRQRSHVAIPIKKRKLYDHTSAWATDEGKGTSRSVTGQHTSLQRRDSQVKLRIKSFRVPELIIEIAETATVGSLKRTVMEAVTAILGGELRIGVILQGQKVRDDNVTLLQSGISHDEHLESLGFTLEPNKPSQNQNQKPAPLCTGESHHFLPGNDVPQTLPLVSFLSSPGTDNEGVSDISPEPDANPDSGNPVESDHYSVPSPIDMLIENRTLDSKALVPVPEISPKALSMVPAIRKKHPEMSQRRIRRPFSVTEVEALVHAVEKLGTGRWRDVKLRAFDDAKHRTYVDLKDKWKTLVHTARIAPQQRRGEPVPQELLDRVLNAHSYWSQQQAKQQLKQHSQTCLLI